MSDKDLPTLGHNGYLTSFRLDTPKTWRAVEPSGPSTSMPWSAACQLALGNPAEIVEGGMGTAEAAFIGAMHPHYRPEKSHVHAEQETGRCRPETPTILSQRLQSVAHS